MTEQSILNSTKLLLSLEPDDNAFDVDIMIHINSVFGNIHQIGVGPDEPFEITGPVETWEDFIGDEKQISSVKTLVYMQVRLWFDPPSTSYGLDAMADQVNQLMWRLQVAADRTGI